MNIKGFIVLFNSIRNFDLPKNEGALETEPFFFYDQMKKCASFFWYHPSQNSGRNWSPCFCEVCNLSLGPVIKHVEPPPA
jgi:hypothetical protein